MTAIVCVDERNGMMFHRRRQSRDRVVQEDILKECGKRKLYMDNYSGAMFENASKESIIISESFLEQAGEGAYCFIENKDINSIWEKLEAVILYNWNRKYPADLYFTLDLKDGNWELQRAEELEGTSHNRITKEVYKRIK